MDCNLHMHFNKFHINKLKPLWLIRARNYICSSNLFCSWQSLFFYIYFIWRTFFIQLEQQILDFSHGLRAIGVAPDEKLALFADNSCRWLVADQGNLPFFFVSRCLTCSMLKTWRAQITRMLELPYLSLQFLHECHCYFPSIEKMMEVTK